MRKKGVMTNTKDPGPYTKKGPIYPMKKEKTLSGIPLSDYSTKELMDFLMKVSAELGKRIDKNNPFQLKAKIQRLYGSKEAGDSLDPYNPRNYCIDCSVHLCCKDSNGFKAWGHSSSRTSFRCPRKKRCHSWKEVKEEKARIAKEAKK